LRVQFAGKLDAQGRGLADPRSLLAALRQAERLSSTISGPAH